MIKHDDLYRGPLSRYRLTGFMGHVAWGTVNNCNAVRGYKHPVLQLSNRDSVPTRFQKSKKPASPTILGHRETQAVDAMALNGQPPRRPDPAPTKSRFSGE